MSNTTNTQAVSNHLTSKVAFVQGGSRGIGAAIAKRLAKDGAAIALTYVSSPQKAEEVVKEIEAVCNKLLIPTARSTFW
jgi:3-oxoacyl-[acyl-carrier protein] reductase